MLTARAFGTLRLLAALALVVLLSGRAFAAETSGSTGKPSSVDTGHRLILQAGHFEHIRFRRIPPTAYRFEQGVLHGEVERSASFLMQAFETVRSIRQVRFRWRASGRVAVKDAAQEASRGGDDAVFKLGLLLADDEAREALFNPLMPAWLKQVNRLLNNPSRQMVNLVADARHAPGSRWPNPYNDRVTMIAVPSEDLADGWYQATWRFEQPQPITAIWLMADGDNSGSSFRVEVSDIVLE